MFEEDHMLGKPDRLKPSVLKTPTKFCE